MGIRIDLTLENYDGSKLNAIEKYDLEKDIHLALNEEIGRIVDEILPSYIKCRGYSTKLVGHSKKISRNLE